MEQGFAEEQGGGEGRGGYYGDKEDLTRHNLIHNNFNIAGKAFNDNEGDYSDKDDLNMTHPQNYPLISIKYH